MGTWQEIYSPQKSWDPEVVAPEPVLEVLQEEALAEGAMIVVCAAAAPPPSRGA
jgi:hypothetical protein